MNAPDKEFLNLVQIPCMITSNTVSLSKNEIRVMSYPEKLSSLVPLPGWLVWTIFWQIIFLIDYLLNRTSMRPEATIYVFGSICLFFTSVCIVTMICSRILIKLYPHLTKFIEEDNEALSSWYQGKLKSCYAGPWPIIAGIAVSVAAILSVYSLIDQLTPPNNFLLYYRTSYIMLGFFFLGIALWALIKVTFVPMELTRMKIKVNITQFSGNGLQYLGASFLKMSLSITMSFILIVLTFVIAPFENNFIVLLWLGLAAILIFAFFLLPQVGIHKVMLLEKNNRMTSFTVHLEEAMNLTLKNPTSENMQRLKELFEVHIHLKSMNEWPFDFNSVWQLLTALIIPIMLAAMEILFKA